MAKQKSTNKPMFFSIVMVVKNDRGIDASLDTLEAIAAKNKDCELLMVDASDRISLDDIAAQHPWVQWIHFKNTTGKRFTIPEQRNLGTQKAKGNVIIFLDANCIPAKGWFETFKRAMSVESHDIATGPIRSIGENKLHDAGYNFPDNYEITECGAANLAIRKDVLQKLGGFDENMSYGEDVDLTWRARGAGYKIIFKKDAEIAHNWGKFNEELRRAYRYGASRTSLYKKHPRQLRRLLGPDINVVIYPAFVLLLPLTFWWPWYPLLILIPLLKNFGKNAIPATILHIVYGLGVIKGIFKTV